MGRPIFTYEIKHRLIPKGMNETTA